MGPPPRKRAWIEAEHNTVNESARLAFVSELSSDGPYVGRRVRTCGWCAMRFVAARSECDRLIAIEPKSSLALLEHNGHGVLVDLTRALESSPGGVPRLKALLTIFGELEAVDVRLGRRSTNMTLEARRSAFARPASFARDVARRRERTAACYGHDHRGLAGHQDVGRKRRGASAGGLTRRPFELTPTRTEREGPSLCSEHHTLLSFARRTRPRCPRHCSRRRA